MPNESLALCECGCGEPAPVAKKTDASTNRVKGRPMRFVSGHNGRVRPPYDGPLYAVDPDTGCWEWQRGKNAAGYGVMYTEGRQSWRAHRWFYLQEHGEVPEFLDHICRNRGCVNPEHLRPTTIALNAQNAGPRRGNFRGASYQAGRKRWVAQATLNYQHHFLGYFETEEEAGAAAAAFRAEYMPNSPEAREKAS